VRPSHLHNELLARVVELRRGGKGGDGRHGDAVCVRGGDLGDHRMHVAGGLQFREAGRGRQSGRVEERKGEGGGGGREGMWYCRVTTCWSQCKLRASHLQPGHVREEERDALVERVVVPGALRAERRGAGDEAGWVLARVRSAAVGEAQSGEWSPARWAREGAQTPSAHKLNHVWRSDASCIARKTFEIAAFVSQLMPACLKSADDRRENED
jgi:hypothetical protein